MNEFKILLKRELCEKLNAFRRRKFSVLNLIFSFLLFGMVLSALVFVLNYVFDIYLSLKIGYEQDILARQKEILTIIYFIVLIVLSLVASYKIKNKITNDKNINALLVLPIKSQSIFLVKFASIFIEVLVSATILLVSVTAVLCVSCGLSAGLIVGAIFISVIISVFALFVGSLFALPLHFITKLLSKHFVVYMIFYAIIIGAIFLLYSLFLGALKDLLESGQIQFLLNQDFVISVHNFAEAIFPCNVFASLVLGIDVWKNLGISIGVLLVLGALAFLIVKYIFGLVSQNRLATMAQYKRKCVSFRRKSVVHSLMAREFIHILRTPAYSLQYFAIALSLPLMVYITATLLVGLLQNLIFVRCDFVIGLFCIVMFTLLTNTFCSGNISREGKYFRALKVLPIDAGQVLNSKVVFSLIVSFVAIFLSCLLLLCVGVFNVWQVAVAFVVCALFSVAEVLFATRLDLNKPDFDKKSGNATNILLFSGIVVSLVLGGVSLFGAMYFSLKFSASTADIYVVITSFVFALVVFLIALLYYKKGLARQYEQLSELN